jgi:energy-coupling factor transporter transmembrane protein EcfT
MEHVHELHRPVARVGPRRPWVHAASPRTGLLAYMLVAIAIFGGGACLVGAITFLVRTVIRP